MQTHFAFIGVSFLNNISMEIKFRGKRVDKEEWIYGSLIHREEGTAENEKEYSAIVLFDKGLDSQYNAYLELEVIPETVGQLWSPSIGLEFYTGDLFTAICSPSGSNKKIERICKVDFDGRGMNVSVWYKKEWWHYGSMNFTTAKIIGNIHQNPELLN